MNARRWVIIGFGLAVVALLTVVALVVDEHWVEVASWVAGVGSFAITAAMFTVSFRSAAPRGPAGPVGSGAVQVSDGNSGIISTGNGATNIQQR